MTRLPELTIIPCIKEKAGIMCQYNLVGDVRMGTEFWCCKFTKRGDEISWGCEGK